MNEDDCLKDNEKIMMREEVIDYKEVMLEEVRQIQKPQRLKKKRSCNFFIERSPTALEVEQTNSERNEGNSEKMVSPGHN
jgi:hypothetical protein